MHLIYGACSAASTNCAVDDRRSQIQKNRMICLLLWQQSIKKKNIGMNAQNMKKWVADDVYWSIMANKDTNQSIDIVQIRLNILLIAHNFEN